MDQIKNLKQQLNYHDNLYYNQDSPELSDAEYDALKKEYLNLTNQQEYDYVPGQAQFKKYTHTFPIKSLSKINSIEEARKEIERLKPVVIEPKYDGLTLVIYPDRKAVTRGSGTIGEDVTNNVVKFARVNHSYGYPIRGEAIMPISVFNKINKQREAEGRELFKNPRNAIAGILRNKDNSNIPEGLKFIAYEIVGSKDSHMQQLIALKEYYDIPEAQTVWNCSEIDDAVKFIENFNRSELDYEIDGLVIKSNKANALDIFGEVEHHPNHSVAYKFPSQGEWTILKSITWQTGRTGRITPVAELESVDIMGSTIERATLHNIAYINALGLQIGDEVLVVKSNDVIPAVIKCEETESSEPIEIINKCPSCGSKLIIVNDQLFCTNDNCQAKILYRFTHFVSRNAMNIEGLSEATLEKFICAGFLNNFADIYKLSQYKSEIVEMDGFGLKSYNNLIKSIEKSKDVKLENFLYALGISQLGQGGSKRLVKHFNNNFSAIMCASINDLMQVEDFGEVTANSVHSYFDNESNQDVVDELQMYVNIKEGETKQELTFKSLDNLTFVVTGNVETFKNRKELEELITSLFGKLNSSVSSKTNFLINNDVTSNSGKNKKAKELSVPIISEQMFNEMIGRNN